MINEKGNIKGIITSGNYKGKKFEIKIGKKPTHDTQVIINGKKDILDIEKITMEIDANNGGVWNITFKLLDI